MNSLLVASPQILQLIEDETGRQRSAMELLGEDRTEALRLYKRLHVSRKTGADQILCELCGVAVYLVSAPDKKHFFFRHFHEDGSCPSVTRSGFTEAQINAIRYQGQRESRRHIRLKTLLDESLQADPVFSKPVIEGSWRGKERKELRRPDVRSRFQGSLDIAFEVQLSTTFGRVMAEREVFYKSEGGLLLWIFGEFTVAHARLMMEVIFASNNRNAFIVNEATRDASLKACALVLECCWSHPTLYEDQVVWTQHRKLVRFDELTLQQERQRAFYVDTDTLEAEILAEIHGAPLAQRFEDFWLAYEAFDGRERPDLAEISEQWAGLRKRFARNGVDLPSRHDDDFKGVLRAIYLAKFGCGVGWGYKELSPGAHHVHDAEKKFLWIFLPALRRFGRLEEIEGLDRWGKWALKMSLWEDGRKSADPAFEEEHRFDAVLRLIFPEVFVDGLFTGGHRSNW